MWWLPILAAFFLGSIPSAVLVGRVARVDVRRRGSGNPGAANTWRTAGRLAGFVVLVLDVFKGWAAVSWLPSISPDPPSWVPAAVGGAAVLGHVFSPFLGLRGGKGVATGAGVIGALAPRLLVGPLALFAIVFALRRRASESSIVATLSLPLVALAFGPRTELLLLCVALAALCVWTHRENLRRIRAGEETEFR